MLRTLLAGVLFFASAAAFAQGYPSPPIRLIVPFTPGGSTDILGRAIGQKLATAIATARREHVHAVLVLPSPAFNRYRRRIAELALRQKLPTCSESSEYVRDGRLLS